MPQLSRAKAGAAPGQIAAVASIPLTRLDIATLAAGATGHAADHALLHKLLANGLLSQNALTGSLELTDRARALLELNGYTFDAKLGWRLDIARTARALQLR
ncbi:hypothetical protein VVD49_04835 [Uliginosibacterium sp. H3]|uniref:Uncharacterized protein n=1 Tax=Uliginosibacterium silvisoli TaxID=3114758 RepID=A0ABU6K047_9RHOO|nr:hypothetical protein [Uliginosibacterium sp. H3]